MTDLLRMGGPYMYILTVLAVVILALATKKTIDLFARTGLDRVRLARGVDAILFWGSISAVLGFLGQFTGAYLSLMIIRSAEMVNPGLVAKGVAVSLITTIYGLGILAVSAIIWFALRSRLNRLTTGKAGGHPAGV